MYNNLFTFAHIKNQKNFQMNIKLFNVLLLIVTLTFLAPGVFIVGKLF